MWWLHEHLWRGAAAVGKSRCQLCRPMDLPVPLGRMATMLHCTSELQSQLTVILSKYHFAATQAVHCQHLGFSVFRESGEEKHNCTSQCWLLTSQVDLGKVWNITLQCQTAKQKCRCYVTQNESVGCSQGLMAETHKKWWILWILTGTQI